MSSGTARTEEWVLEFPPEDREIDPLMGWTSSADTQSQVRLTFADQGGGAGLRRLAAGSTRWCRSRRSRRPNLRPGGYGENFATARREPWSH